MKCPVDGNELRITERQGVEIDYCPQCRGVWLDRGELDKLIERSAALERQPERRPYREEDDDDYHEREERPEHHKHRKKESFWGRMFDFD